MFSGAETIASKWKHRMVSVGSFDVWRLRTRSAHIHTSKARAKLRFYSGIDEKLNFLPNNFFVGELRVASSKLNIHTKWRALNRWLLRKNNRQRNKLTEKRYVYWLHLRVCRHRRFAAIQICVHFRRVHCCCGYSAQRDAIIRRPNSVMAIYHRTNYKFTHGRMQRYANWLPSYVMWTRRPDAKVPILILHSFRRTNMVLAIVCAKSVSPVLANGTQTIRCHWHRQSSTSVIIWTLILRHRIVCRHNRDALDNTKVSYQI